MKKSKIEYMHGKNLRVGDTIKAWFCPAGDTIISLEEYTGPLRALYTQYGGQRTAKFANYKVGCSIDPLELYAVTNKRTPKQKATKKHNPLTEWEI